MGALILFGCVQATMIIFALVKGERPNGLEWLGLIVAVGGLVYLVSPGLTSPPVFSAVFDGFCRNRVGILHASRKGKRESARRYDGKFYPRRAVCFGYSTAVFISQFHYSKRGILFAVLSGAIASGIGYAVWYAALKFHTATRAAILQLAVPVLAAIGGVLLLSEVVTLRLLISALLILGGICAAILGRNKFKIS